MLASTRERENPDNAAVKDVCVDIRGEQLVRCVNARDCDYGEGKKRWVFAQSCFEVEIVHRCLFLFAELLEDLLPQKPSETDGVESVIVIDGVPKVEPKRLEKLQSVIEKIYGKFGTIVNKSYPQDESGMTKG